MDRMHCQIYLRREFEIWQRVGNRLRLKGQLPQLGRPVTTRPNMRVGHSHRRHWVCILLRLDHIFALFAAACGYAWEENAAIHGLLHAKWFVACDTALQKHPRNNCSLLFPGCMRLDFESNIDDVCK